MGCSTYKNILILLHSFTDSYHFRLYSLIHVSQTRKTKQNVLSLKGKLFFSKYWHLNNLYIQNVQWCTVKKHTVLYTGGGPEVNTNVTILFNKLTVH